MTSALSSERYDAKKGLPLLLLVRVLEYTPAPSPEPSGEAAAEDDAIVAPEPFSSEPNPILLLFLLIVNIFYH